MYQGQNIADDNTTSTEEVLNRIAEVSAMLQLEEGDRLQLRIERARLIEIARRIGILKPAA